MQAGFHPAGLALRRSARTCGLRSFASVFPEPLPHTKVFNQSKELADYNCYLSDGPLRKAMATFGATWANDYLTNIGKVAGSKDMLTASVEANRSPPVLRTHDRFGNRVDVVDFHPSYHRLMRTNLEEFQLATFAWLNGNKRGSQVARGAGAYMAYQMDAGTQCPQTMTFACVPLLEKALTPAQKQHFNWREKMKVYDERNLPLQQKRGMTIGMSMTERQGGSDVRANTTVAVPIDKAKQTEKGLSCFIVPRWVPSTGERNRGLFFLRLKEKLGDKSNASSEVEYRDAYGELVGEDGRGVATILEMVHHTRLDCTMGSAGLMRRCLMEAANHARVRTAFGVRLLDAPLMQNVLGHLVVESESFTLLSMFIASLFDDHTPQARKLCRLATAVAKYHTCKRAPSFAYEAMECLGGNGYIEESPMPYLLRQSPLNAIWEGSGNVICLDVLRSVTADPECYALLVKEIEAGLNGSVDRSLLDGMRTFNPDQRMLRQTVTTLALALQRKEIHYGTLAADTDFAKILAPYEDLDGAQYAKYYQSA